MTRRDRAKTRRSGRHRRRRRGAGTRRWSQEVTRTSHALDLEEGVFTLPSAKAIAASLKRSALRSRRRKASPYRSALSMLVFYINRAGHALAPARRRVLEAAKRELRVAFSRDVAPTRGRSAGGVPRRGRSGAAG